MPVAQIQFGKTYHSLDPSQARGNITYDLINGTVDVDGSFVKREGLTLFSSGITATGTGVLGMYEDSGGRVFGCAEGNLYAVGSAGAITQLTGTGAVSTANLSRWCEDVANPFMVNGNYILKINPTANTFQAITANAPSGVTFITFQDQYLLCNGLLSGGVVGDTNYSDDRASGYSATSSWECYNNEYGPDGLSLVWSKWSEVYNGGPRTIETTYDSGDANNPWAKVQVPVMTCGVLASYSWVEFDDTFLWLAYMDGRPAVVTLNARTPTVISDPWGQSFQALTTRTDAFGMKVLNKDQPCYLISFPTDNKTFCYNLRTKVWSQWSSYSGGQHLTFPVCTSLYAKGWGKRLLGSLADGRIFTHAGYTDAGSAIRFELTSGGQTHGTDHFKPSRKLNFRWKSGNATNTFRYLYRDEGGSWSSERTIGPNARTSDGVYYTSINNVGRYRNREHKIIHDATDSDFIFIGIEETYDVGAY